MNTIPQSWLAVGAGLLIGAFLMHIGLGEHSVFNRLTINQADPYDTAYHVHTDFLIYINDTRLDLTDEQYQTFAGQELSKHVHLHDNNDKVVHIHEESITFAEFLNSLGILLTEDCITTQDKTYCTDGVNQLQLFVDGNRYTENITAYVPTDDQAVLLYYGDGDSSTIETYLSEITDDSCLYTGTCPERGVAPPESCGLTCEL